MLDKYQDKDLYITKLTQRYEALTAHHLTWTTVRELFENRSLASDEPLVLAIACNKVDLTDKRVVSWDVAAQYAESIGALIYDTSAKSNTGVSQVSIFRQSRLTSRPPCPRARAPCSPPPRDPYGSRPIARGCSSSPMSRASS